MSLAHGEQQALTQIEAGLRASDPRFVRMLGRLAKQLPPKREPGRTCRRRRLSLPGGAARVILLAVIATLVVAGVVAGTVIATRPGHVTPRLPHAVAGRMLIAAPGLLFLG